MRHKDGTFAAVDWGTTSFRAWHIDAASGEVVDSHTDPKGGILESTEEDWAAQLYRRIGAWRVSEVYCCGMITSRQGWMEVPYATTPADENNIRAAATTITCPGRFDKVVFVPGLRTQRPAAVTPDQLEAPDVMRGEETQILGSIDRMRPQLPATEYVTVLLPGTHSKWARVRVGGGRDPVIVTFRTYMTGELFAVLKAHSILGKLMSPVDAEGRLVGGDRAETSRGFAFGAKRAMASAWQDDASLLLDAFRVRTIGLDNGLPPANCPRTSRGF